MKYKYAAVGGTFDRLHRGHRKFITKAFEVGKKVLVGLTSEEYAVGKIRIKNQESRIRENIRSYCDRKNELERFLEEMGWQGRVRIVEIDDVYGGADGNRELEAIAVTPDTARGADLINVRRKTKGLKPLEVVVVDFERDAGGGIISSTRIRNGEMDREGRLYSHLKLWGGKIPEELRQKLKEPIGELIRNKSEDPGKIAGKLKTAVEEYRSAMLVTVGDEVTKLANLLGLGPDLAVFDFFVKRVEKYRKIQDLGIMNRESPASPSEAGRAGTRGKMMKYTEVNNPPGSITHDLVNEIGKAIAGFCSSGQGSIIKVDGEDDLAGLPAMLLAPLGSIVLYGQPDEGVVLVKVEEAVKGKLMENIGKMQD